MWYLSRNALCFGPWASKLLGTLPGYEVPAPSVPALSNRTKQRCLYQTKMDCCRGNYTPRNRLLFRTCTVETMAAQFSRGIGSCRIVSHFVCCDGDVDDQ